MLRALRYGLPVVQRDVYHSVRQMSHSLVGLSPYVPRQLMLRPLVPSLDSGNNSTLRACKFGSESWAMLMLMPDEKAYIVTNRGALLQTWKHKVTSICGANPDASRPASCKLWHGTILGVELGDTDWYAMDAYVISGHCILDKSFAERRRQLLTLRETCMPTLKIGVDELDASANRVCDVTSTVTKPANGSL